MTRPASRVFATHGVAAIVDSGRFGFRNLSSVRQLDAFLTSSPRFVPLSDALADRGDALTIDDATRAGKEAALLARRHGHAVTLFVNPGQVESGAPYAFVVLNALLDGLDGRPKELDGRRFVASTTAERQTLRRAIKAKLREVADEQARLNLVEALAVRWGVTHLDVPPHFSTLCRDDLNALRDAGVDLQNHGWFHADHATLSGLESERNISKGREWLHQELGADARYFAVPFGEALPKNASAACDVWFTVTRTLPAGRQSARVFNRETPVLPEDDSSQRTAGDPSGSLRSWTSRIARLVRRS